jgi:hypothetical protein
MATEGASGRQVMSVGFKVTGLPLTQDRPAMPYETSFAKVCQSSQQEKCADGARKTFNDWSYKPNDLASYENHYNAKLSKCFIHLAQTDTKTSPGTIIINRTLLDAFEGRTYAAYYWQTQKSKKY